MEPFTTLKSTAAPLDMVNVDTDIIYPKQFLRTIHRTGLGKHAFHDLRYLADGSNNPDFVLNNPTYKDAQILVTGENFGAGSSREHAVWSLMDMGFRCIISPRFADIFANNSYKNGLLLIEIDSKKAKFLSKIIKSAPKTIFSIDLDQQTLCFNDETVNFDIDSFKKRCLLEGLDDIALTLEHEAAIQAFEDQRKTEKPWTG